MSGGHYDYAYNRVYDAADAFECELPRIQGTVLNERRWFVEHLRLVAKAMHDIEWVDSGDYSLGGELEAIAAVRAHLR